jgi:hypothetical protein
MRFIVFFPKYVLSLVVSFCIKTVELFLIILQLSLVSLVLYLALVVLILIVGVIIHFKDFSTLEQIGGLVTLGSLGLLVTYFLEKGSKDTGEQSINQNIENSIV